ncbi:MAG: hypothetical protein KJ630_19250 [Proteobacteria bacterium]|nr:hypothetical protein [Pseudomonadota bacterium]
MSASFPQLTKPFKGLSFWIGGVLIHVNFAKTLVWSEQNYNGSQQTDIFFGFNRIRRSTLNKKIRKIVHISAISVVVGPFKFMVGISERTPKKNK